MPARHRDSGRKLAVRNPPLPRPGLKLHFPAQPKIVMLVYPGVQAARL